MENTQQREEKVKLAIEIAIKVGLLALVIYLTYLIAKPFIAIVVWGIIIAVAIAPLIDSLEKRFGNRKKIIIGVTIAVIIAMMIPTYSLSGKMAASSQTIVHAMKDGTITIPPPTEKVKEWPVIGEKSYAFWDSASKNLKEALAPFSEKIKDFAGTIFSKLGGMIATIFMFIGSMLIAAVFLLASENSIKFYKNISRRLLGDNGTEWAHVICTDCTFCSQWCHRCRSDTGNICLDRYGTDGCSFCYGLGCWCYVLNYYSNTCSCGHRSRDRLCFLSRVWNS